jgi:4-alpha-glucanotransferase
MARPARPTALDRLAERYGIEATYGNAMGETVVIAPAVKRRLLSAMGVAADSDIDGLLDALDEAEWSRGLPPVIVDRTGGADVTAEVTVPRGADRIAWKLTLEDDRERCGEAVVGDLAVTGQRRTDDGPFERRRLALGALPLGYHRLALNEPGVETSLIVAPDACWLPGAMTDGHRTWGLAVQLYLIRSAGNWGIGDFADLRKLIEIAGGKGANVVGVNPLHALFPDDPERASPYSPASRLLLNPLNIAVPEVAGFNAGTADDLAPLIMEARAAALVDYTAVMAAKMTALRRLYPLFRSDGGGRAAFERFVEGRSEGFRRACLFMALREHFAAATPPQPDWRHWPDAFQGPGADGAIAFATENAEAVEFQMWLQWVADEQLAQAAVAAADQGMAVGLYRDLAVGADPAGAETWASASAVIRGAAVGAPPDIFMPGGQNWGLPPFHPRALREEAYASFIDLVRANMRHAGGLRIDHVMGLQHLWCVPEGSPATEGAYLAYPMDDLVGILALESHRNRCLVVGEDLGTVPVGFRERMESADILSYRGLFFEQDFDENEYVPPEDYPEKAISVSGSHDLPTLRGWWRGRDNELKEALGLFPSPAEVMAQRERRERDRASLVRMLQGEGLLTDEPDEDSFVVAATTFLARSRAALAMAQLDDVTGETEQVNVPATDAEHSNWRRRYALTLEDLNGDDAPWRLVEPLRHRGQGGHHVEPDQRPREAG